MGNVKFRSRFMGAGTAKDLRIPADSEHVKATKMSTDSKITDIEDAATARWLSGALAPAQRQLQTGPSDEAIERIWARVFEDAAPRSKPASSIAA